jgi:hypothetical protein
MTTRDDDDDDNYVNGDDNDGAANKFKPTKIIQLNSLATTLQNCF